MAWSSQDLLTGAGFLWRLPGFLRRRVTLGEAQGIVRRRLASRELDFLAVARLGVYGHPPSPYRQLLRQAGCEYGDLDALVRRDGLDAALRTLFRAGVYLTVEEFKGRRPAVRGGATIDVDPDDLRNPLAAFHVPAGSGGSRGPATPIVIDLAFIRDCGVNSVLALHARGGAEWVKAHWLVPGASALARVLEFASFGAPPRRWYSQVDLALPGLHPRYRWSARVARWASLAAGVPLPPCRYVSLEDPRPIAEWMAEILRGGRTPHLYTYASSALRVCQAAEGAHLSLRGARFTVSGEPATEARLAAVREVGAVAVPRYATTEVGPIGDACCAPAAAADDVHLYDDLHAVIQPGPDGREARLPPETVLISSLRGTAPFVLINVSTGDQATMERRACGCPMAALGWSTHLWTIRSFEKLTVGGMTFLDVDVIHALDAVLPRRFGGLPTDYQLLEEEAAAGGSRLRLVVHPRLGSLDARAIEEAFLDAIGRGSGGAHVMARQWRELRVLQVERTAPRISGAGKILHLFAAGTSRPPG